MFLDRLVELRELDAVAGPTGDNPISAIVDRSRLDSAKQKDLYSLMEQIAVGLQKLSSAAQDESASPATFSLSIEDEEVGEVVKRVMLEGVLHTRREKVGSHARTGALMLMAGAFETLVASIATELLNDSPERVSDKTLTVGKLEELGSVEAARRFAVERSVESLMHGGIAEWSKFFSSFEVQWKEVATDWWGFREIDARRNLVAHANSTVNELYLGLAREAGAPVASLPQAGEELDVSTEYLSRSLEILAAFGALLGVGTLLKRRPAELTDTYRWGERLSSQFFDWGLPHACSSLTGKLLAISRGRLERTLDLDIRHTDWLARNRIGGVESVRSEVEAFDYSGLELLHSHMRAVVLGDYETAKAQITTLIENGTLTRTAIRLRPQYADMLSSVSEDWMDKPGGTDQPESPSAD